MKTNVSRRGRRVRRETTGDVNADETGFVYSYSGTVTNEGFGTVYDVTVTDKGETFELGTLAPQESKGFGGT